MTKQRAMVIDAEGRVENVIIVDSEVEFAIPDRALVRHDGYVDLGWQYDAAARVVRRPDAPGSPAGDSDARVTEVPIEVHASQKEGDA